MAGGLLIAAVGFGVLAQVDGPFDLATLVIGSIIMFFGIAPAFTLATDLIVGTAPQERAGAASAISETSAELGGALGIAVLGSIGAAVYRSTVSGIIPSAVPTKMAGAARDTLGGALALAQRLPHRLGTDLIAGARASFIRGLQVTSLIGVVVTIATAVVAAAVLRNVGSRVEDDSVESATEPGDTSLS
jgi:DHA2 family multidrug resistance protein-like MFS transporter